MSENPLSRFLPSSTSALLIITLLGVSSSAAARPLRLRAVEVPLPGPPAAIVPADLDGDGIHDLSVVVAYTRWDQISIEESSEIDGIEGLVEVLTIVPSLLDRRELRVYLGQQEGGYVAAGEPLELGLEVLALAAGTATWPVVALTDSGLSALRLQGPTDDRHIVLEPVLKERPVMAGSGIFLPRLELAQDLDGDGDQDILFPAANGAAIYLDQNGQLQLASRQTLPTDRRYASGGRLYRHYPRPQVKDVTGDGLPDILSPDDRHGWQKFHLQVGLGNGRFGDPREPLEGTRLGALAAAETKAANGAEAGQDTSEESAEQPQEEREELVHFGDLDGDGRGEYLTSTPLSDGKDGLRAGLAEVKRPSFRFAIYPSAEDRAPAAEPSHTFPVTGYSFGGESSIGLPGGMRDLDGDGRLDLITLTLEFSMLQALRILATKSLSVGIDFHLWCQQQDGSFGQVDGLDLSGKLRLNLKDLALGQLSQFAGDFDGDGRADFVQMGRGKKVTIHRGQPGCSYPGKPDLVLKLADAPRDLGLVRVEDFDGDGLSDLLIIQPERAVEAGVTPPVRLDLYLSGERS